MKKRTKLKIWFDKLFNNTIDVNNIDELKYYLADAEKKLKNIEDNFYKQEGYIKAANANIEKGNKRKQSILNSRDKLNKKGLTTEKDKEMMRSLIKAYTLVEEELKGYESDLELSIELKTNMELQKNTATKNVEDIKRKIRLLERKSEYSDRVEEFNSIIKTNTTSEIKSISDEIDVKFYTAEAKLDDINKQIVTKNFIEDVEELSIDEFLCIENEK